MSAAGDKKLINTVERCVDDNLEGYVAMNPGVRLLKGHRVLIRSDFEELQKAGKVAVVCGGGSGHEPAFSGYIGRGMLAAAAMGAVFACPPSSVMLAAVRAVAKNNPAGCFMIVPNYTGDRLNFGLAAERAQGEGIRIATCVVGEDCALTTNDKSAGRRGLTGMIVSIKIAGALAEEGRSLEEIVHVVRRAVQNMATIGVALSPCFVPGSGPTFTLPSDEMELGLGVHGEAGVRRLKVKTAKETVTIMLDHMTSTDNSNRLPLEKGDRVAVFINDLGGISSMELNIIAKESIDHLESKGIKVIRASCTAFVTSLEMAGTHVTVLRLDDDFTRCLDAPTEATHWPRMLLPTGVVDRFNPGPLELPHVETPHSEDVKAGITSTQEEGQRVHRMLSEACQTLVGSESTLNFLDSGAGDGDCGSTLARGAKEFDCQCWYSYVEEVLKQLGSPDKPGLPVCNPALLALRLAEIAEAHMGGASGALYGLFFTGAHTALLQEGGSDTWTEALRQGMAIVMQYSGAEPGDRTMLDALQPVLETLTSTVGATSPSRFEQAVLAAEKGAEATLDMKACAGRASYVSSALLQQPDPGALGVAKWLRAAYQAYVTSATTN